ncbi:MAG: helix-turn-helix domain-containing protein, partial [Acidaminococcaceae bacterium]|nr:helix-turn-helix domain-containing protein [Acidaminococcaceae bacterium]
MYDEKCLQNIGGNIRFLRMARQVSQQDMAESIGISQTHLSNLERNHVNVNLKLLLRIANVLGCPLEVFLDTQGRRWIGAKSRQKRPRLSRTLLQKPIRWRKCSGFCSCCGCQTSKAFTAVTAAEDIANEQEQRSKQ